MRVAAALLTVLLIGLVGCGGGDDTTTVINQAPPAETATQATTPSTGEVPLTAVDGSSASGSASVLSGGKPEISIDVEGLQPTGPGETYLIWLYDSDEFAFPLGRDRVGADGTLQGAVPVPKAILPVVSRFAKVRISRATGTETQAALKAAVGSRQLPGFVGVPVLEGDNPRS